MLDLSKLTTEKGSKVEVHYEDETAETYFEEVTEEELIEIINRQEELNPNGGTIHFVVNNQRVISVMSDDDFLAWQENPGSERDWFHIYDDGFGIVSIQLSLGDLFGFLCEDEECFEGATKEDFDKLLETPGMIPYLKTIAADENCVCCPVPFCPMREASFDISKLDDYIANFDKE